MTKDENALKIMQKKKNRVKKNSKRYIETPKREVQAKVK